MELGGFAEVAALDEPEEVLVVGGFERGR